jgi:hypothetical protein
MKLYEVIFWNSHTERPNKDTIYLVRAQDFMAAIHEVATNSSPSHHGGDKIRLAHVVYEVARIFRHKPAQIIPAFCAAHILKTHTIADGRRGTDRLKAQNIRASGRRKSMLPNHQSQP